MVKRFYALTLACASLLACAWAGDACARTLQSGESLMQRRSMLSEDSRYLGVMQHDGNFVVYRNDGLWRQLWPTNTTGRGAVSATMQRDGNFVLYDNAGRAIWWTGSNGSDRVFAITEHEQAMVLAPGKIDRREPGPRTVLLAQLGFKRCGKRRPRTMYRASMAMVRTV
jgi:hypothetical protein